MNIDGVLTQPHQGGSWRLPLAGDEAEPREGNPAAQLGEEGHGL